MAGKSGNYKVIEQFLADGMDVMFGNPGTVEQGFLDAMSSYPEMMYILNLQESIAVLMADGYARATQKPTLVQLHSSPGIGNAVGALYQAKRGHAPLVVIGGDAGVKYMNMDAQMANDLVAMMAPVTKYSTQVTDSKSLLRTIRRAVKIATTAPMGPVYICLPMDVLDEINEEEVFPACVPSTRILPDQTWIKEVANTLLSSKTPMIFAGDGVAYSNANDELTELAELLGAEVYGVEFGDVLMDNTHPLYQGSTGHMFGESSYPITSKGDVNLVVGTYMLPEVFPKLEDIYAPTAKVIHIDLNSYEIAKNHRVDLGVVADPKLTLQAIIDQIKSIQSTDFTIAASTRFQQIKAIKDQKLLDALKKDETVVNETPLHMSVFAKTLSEMMPKGTIIFDEALTNSPAVSRYMPATTPGSYFYTRGGSLGIGIPGALGVKVADPSKSVIGFTGDGGSMYTIQALWSAVRHKIGAKFVVCNNGSYHLLQLNIDEYWKERAIGKHEFPLPFDLSYPAFRFDLIAQSMGVEAVRVEKVEDIAPAIARMFESEKPFLIDLVLEGEVRPEKVNTHCGQ